MKGSHPTECSYSQIPSTRYGNRGPAFWVRTRLVTDEDPWNSGVFHFYYRAWIWIDHKRMPLRSRPSLGQRLWSHWWKNSASFSIGPLHLSGFWSKEFGQMERCVRKCTYYLPLREAIPTKKIQRNPFFQENGIRESYNMSVSNPVSDLKWRVRMSQYY